MHFFLFVNGTKNNFWLYNYDIIVEYRLDDWYYNYTIGERGASWQGHFLWIYLNFFTTRFANWMNESDSDFNSLWIDRICLQCSFTRNCETEKNCKKKSLPTCPTYGVSWQVTILHCSKISRSNFENLQLSISWEICMPTCPNKFLPTNPTGCFSNK